MSCVLQGCGEPLQVSGPLGEHQAVPPSGQGLAHVSGDLGRAWVIFREFPVDRGHPARSGWVGVARVAEPGGVYAEDRRWSGTRVGRRQVKPRQGFADLVPGCGWRGG